MHSILNPNPSPAAPPAYTCSIHTHVPHPRTQGGWSQTRSLTLFALTLAHPQQLGRHHPRHPCRADGTGHDQLGQVQRRDHIQPAHLRRVRMGQRKHPAHPFASTERDTRLDDDIARAQRRYSCARCVNYRNWCRLWEWYGHRYDIPHDSKQSF